MEDMHRYEPRRRIIRKWPITYIIGQVRKVGMPLRVYMVRKRYGVEVRQVTYAKREYQSTNNFHNSDR